MAGNNTYDAGSIAVLEGLEAVRKRPGMYIGSVSTKGLNHLIYEIVDNAVDEHLAGFCSEIQVTLEKDGSATVSDNGRGVPVDMHQKGVSAARLVYTTLHAGGKFDDSAYKTSGGLHGVGSSVVNALSNWLEVEIYQDGKKYIQRYEKGHTMYPLKEEGSTDQRGTKVTFLPDETIFTETTEYSFDILRQRLREMAFLTKGIKIILTDLREEKERTETFHYEGGIKEYVQYLNKNKEPLYDDIIYCEGQKGDVYVEVSFQHNSGYYYTGRWYTSGRI